MFVMIVKIRCWVSPLQRRLLKIVMIRTVEVSSGIQFVVWRANEVL